MENRNESLALVRKWLLRRNLGEAIMAMENFMTAYPQQINADRLASISDDGGVDSRTRRWLSCMTASCVVCTSSTVIRP